jgi:DNA-directed RNA polymerase specialized sigma24 family protein
MDEELLLDGLLNNDVRAYQALRKEYAEDLIIFAYMLLHDGPRAHDVVDRFLLKLYQENGFSEATLPLHAFLYKRLRKECETEIWNSFADPDNAI